jgi:hypothetical protein
MRSAALFGLAGPTNGPLIECIGMLMESNEHVARCVSLKRIALACDGRGGRNRSGVVVVEVCW